MELTPLPYNSAETYYPGAIVQDTNGMNWFSMVENNVGNTPGGNNNSWEAYFGPLDVQPYDTTGATAYYAGDLVYLPFPNGTSEQPLYGIYISLANNNSDVPNVGQTYNAANIYSIDQLVKYSGSTYISLIELNKGNTPTNAPAPWNATTSYVTNNTVAGSDGIVYTALQNSLNINPAGGANATYWSNAGVPAAWGLVSNPNPYDLQWLPIGCTLKTVVFSYPIGSGPSTETFSRNVFRLPSGYLKMANQDPRAGDVSILGAPTGRMPTDWYFQSNFFTSMDPGPIVFRFVADITKVIDMDDMFCEGLAARMAYVTCERITQSTEKRGSCRQAYAESMGEARMVNAIEIGPETQPEDDWITTRL
jgi:hypothetical protein